MWIHRFSLNINPQHVRTKVAVRAIFLVPWIDSSLHNRMYMLLEGQSSFMDASGRHAVFSKLPKGYVHHCDKLERTHTVSPLVKEARTRCLVTLPHERDECQGQCITFHVGLDPRWRCSFTWTERPIKPTLRQSLTGVTVPG